MREIKALVHLALGRHPWLTRILLGLVLVGHAAAVVVALSFPSSGGAEIGKVLSAIVTLPSILCAVAMFDYGHLSDLSESESGCSSWVLRMPIDGWKIGLVPIGLKTTWTCGIWLLFIATASTLGYEPGTVPIVGPMVCASAGLLWVLWIAWQPVRTGWLRILMVVIALPTIYFLLLVSFGVVEPRNEHWQPWSTAASIVAYVKAVVATLRAATVAKYTVGGSVPEKGPNAIDVEGETRRDRKRFHTTATKALIWHDLTKTSLYLRYVFLLGIVPTTLLATLFIPLHPGSLIVLVYLFAVWGTIATAGIGMPSHHEIRPTLPPYLAASPITSANIAWTRFCTTAALTFAISCLVVFVFAGWAMWPANRQVWWTWATEQAVAIGAEQQIAQTGLRLSTAIVFSGLIGLTSVLVSGNWITMMGRTKINSLAGSILIGFLVVILGFTIRWFLRQTDWESTMASIQIGLTYVPGIAATLLTAKVVATAAAAFIVRRKKLATTGSLATVFVAWGFCVCVIAIALYALIPDPRFTLWISLGATALVMPLAGVTFLPASVSFNRHR